MELPRCEYKPYYLECSSLAILISGQEHAHGCNYQWKANGCGLLFGLDDLKSMLLYVLDVWVWTVVVFGTWFGYTFVTIPLQANLCCN